MVITAPAPARRAGLTERVRARLRPANADRTQYVLVAIVAVATLIRFGTLGAKSYWLDEGFTINLLHLSFGQMLQSLHARESNPPLFYALAWIWVRVLGYSEFGLRSLSALAGVLTIPVTYAVARRLIGRRGALMTAALLAVNPLLVWYSQEARTYALFVLLAAFSLLFFARALERPDPKSILAWGASCLLMLATHYFAVFLIVAEAGWLLWTTVRRLRLPWLLGIAALPLMSVAIAVSQAQSGAATRASWGGGSTLASRVINVPGEFLTGFEARPLRLFAVVTGLLVLVALTPLLRGASPSERRGVMIAGSIGLVTVALPIAAAVLGHDYLSPRNVIVALLPLWIVIGAGLGARAAGAVGRLAALGLCTVALTAVVSTAWTPKYHTQDWRNVAAAMGPSGGARAVLVAPAFGTPALAAYLRGGLTDMSRSSPPVSEIDVIAISTAHFADTLSHDPPVPVPRAAPTLPAVGFRLAEIDRRRRFTLVRFVSSRPLRVTLAIARAADFVGQPAAVVVEPAPH